MSADDNETGYGRPPVAFRFKPGQSGNPRGRPKGARGLSSIVRGAASQLVTIVENGRRKTVTKLDAALKHTANKAASGDDRATRLLIELLREFEIVEAPRSPESVKTATQQQAEDEAVHGDGSPRP